MAETQQGAKKPHDDPAYRAAVKEQERLLNLTSMALHGHRYTRITSTKAH